MNARKCAQTHDRVRAGPEDRGSLPRCSYAILSIRAVLGRDCEPLRSECFLRRLWRYGHVAERTRQGGGRSLLTPFRRLGLRHARFHRDLWYMAWPRLLCKLLGRTTVEPSCRAR